MPPDDNATNTSESKTVLVVEDNPTDVFVIKEVLQSCGCDLRVTIAKDGQEALLYLRALVRDTNAECPAVILLDLNLPKVTGVEVLAEFRKCPRCKRTPVIIVTSSSAAADRVMAQRLGAEAYFQKPSDLAAYMGLAQVVRRVLHVGEDL